MEQVRANRKPGSGRCTKTRSVPDVTCNGCVMALILTDSQIQAFLAEPKPITPDFRNWIAAMEPVLDSDGNVTDHLDCSRRVTSTAGNKFMVVLRQNSRDLMDFSIGLRVVLTKKLEVALIRCNGWHGEHRNKCHRGTPAYIVPADTCHVHVQLERYLLKTGKPKKIGFASPTEAYESLAGALEYFVDCYGFVSSQSNKPFNIHPLFRR